VAQMVAEVLGQYQLFDKEYNRMDNLLLLQNSLKESIYKKNQN
jgi:hypothetical protein